MVLILLWVCPATFAQASTAFGAGTKFGIPAQNGAISFAVNGNYSTASLEGNKWVFTNLQLNRSEPLRNLEISTENSNITVFSYRNSTSGFPNSRISYFAQGLGKQTINMGVGSYGGTKVDWVVSSNGTFVSKGWSVSHNGTVTVTGLTGNISVIYFGFTNNLVKSNLPFYEQHSVAIAVAVALAAIVGVAAAVNVTVKRRSVSLPSEPPKEAET